VKHIKRFLPLIVLIVAIIMAYSFGLQNYLSLESIKDQKEEFQTLIDSQPIFSSIGFVAIYAVCVALSLPIAIFLTLLGGFLFGLVKGTLLVVTGATIGATIIFVIAKTSLGSTLRDKAGGLYKKVEGNMKENAFGYLFFMRFVPIFPFVLVNILPALFNVPLRIFLITTFFGIMPGSAAFVYFGEQLGEIESLSDLASPKLFLAFGILGIFALIPTIYKQWKNRKNKLMVNDNDK